MNISNIGKAIGLALLGKDGYNELFSTKSLIDENSVDRLPGQNMFSVQIPDLAAVWGHYTDSNLSVLYHEIAEIFTPVHFIAAAVASGVYSIKKKSDDSVVDNAYMNQLFASPNPLQNWHEFIYQAIAYECVVGKQYIYANCPDTLSQNYRNISTLINLPADNVQIQTAYMIKVLSATTIEDLILNYAVPDGTQGLVRIPPAKVLYTKYPSLYAYDLNIRGRSPLLSAQKAIQNLIAVYEARNVIYTKRGALGIIVSKKSDADGMSALTPSERKQLQEDFHGSYGLKSKHSPVALTNLPVDYVSIAMSIKELEPFIETEHDAAAIFAVFNVPRELMPSQKGATYENQNNAEKRLYDNVAIPRAKSLVKSLTTFLKLDEAGLYMDVDFGHIKVLQENLKEKSAVDWRNNETYRVRFANGICTLNDWRVSCGLKPSVNALYNKLLYDMTPEDLAKVEQVLKLSGGNSPKASGEGGNGDAGSTADSNGNAN